MLLGCCEKGIISADPVDGAYVCDQTAGEAFERLVAEIGPVEAYHADALARAAACEGEMGGISFVGSSTFTLWGSLEDDFPQFSVRNMGIGGSTINHIVAHNESLVFANRPDVVVLYIGDNDASQMAFDDFCRKLDIFAANLRYRLPEVKLVLLSIKPHLAGVSRWDFYRAVNSAYAKRAAMNERVYFVDIWTPMFEGDTAGYFLSDMLHLNRSGYAVVIERLTPVLQKLVQ